MQSIVNNYSETSEQVTKKTEVSNTDLSLCIHYTATTKWLIVLSSEMLLEATKPFRYGTLQKRAGNMFAFTACKLSTIGTKQYM